MISLILYGRNDTYGYNLHKRAAISLNCMAEVLTDPDDEIIFVDYNTPDDFPTFPEAIQDTLTEKAKRLLRILRVRSKHHERFNRKTHLIALEPVARNVAIRRSNPKNRWILSTNTDMVFVPRREKSLSEIARGLPDGYYHLPRFEVPETLWESVSRTDPKATIAAFEAWGRECHLNEIVYAQDPEVLYDAPGDFQLMLRSDAWKIFGFDESMLLGWHVDSNMAKRLSLLGHKVGNVVEDLFGYHCDHTRQVTPMHKPQGTQNDLKVYFQLVRGAAAKKQAKSWGLANEKIEELSLAGKQPYASALRAATPKALDGVTSLRYAGATFNQIDYDPEHVFPFLADSLSSYPRNTVLAWSGAKKALLNGFARVWREMGFSKPILVFSGDDWLGPELPEACVWATVTDACRKASVFVFDWGRPESARFATSWAFDRDPVIREVARHFRSAVRHERARLTRGVNDPRRFIGVNAINNAMEGVFSNHIGASRTPIATRIRQGFAVETITKADLLDSLYIGEAGQRLQSGIVPLPRKKGFVFFGPYLDLDSALYRLTLEFERLRFRSKEWTALTLEVVSNDKLIACREITKADLKTGRVELAFFLMPEIADSFDWPRVEFRLRTPGAIDFVVRKVSLDDCGPAKGAIEPEELEIAPLLFVGPAGRRERNGVQAVRGIADLVTYGPYFWLPDGQYEAVFQLKMSRRAKHDPIRAYVAYHLGRVSLGDATIQPKRVGLTTCIIHFQVFGEAPPPEFGLLEFLVWSRGRSSFSLRSLKVRRLSSKSVRRALPEPDAGILPLLYVKRAARKLPGAILILAGVSGVAVQSAKLPLPAGAQRFELTFRRLASSRIPSGSAGVTVEALARGRIVARKILDNRELQRGKAVFDFDVVTDSWGEEIQFLLRTKGFHELEITSAQLCERAAPSRTLQAPDEMVAISP